MADRGGGGVNYIDVIATEIQQRADDTDEPLGLYRLYALLALTTGPQTTNRHVHDAWAAWTASHNPTHPFLGPYDTLPVWVQMLDDPYTQAIREVAAQFWQVGEPS